MSPKPLFIPLVGMHFRPPARAILAALRAGTPLALDPEPSNPYDPKAIKVLVSLREVPLERWPGLDEACQESGHSLPELLEAEAASGEAFHLGYLADSDGKLAAGKPGNREASALLNEGPCATTLAFDANGQPQVRLFTEARE